MQTSIDNININRKIWALKNKLYKNKILFKDFLQCFVFDDIRNLSINKYILTYLYENEEDIIDSKSYLYWVSGGFAWNIVWNNMPLTQTLTHDEKLALIDGCLDIHYIFQHSIEQENKIKIIYNDLITHIKNKLEEKNIFTKIVTENFSIVNDNIFMFDYTNFKTTIPSFKIKLVLDNTKMQVEIGGAKKPRTRRYSYFSTRMRNSGVMLSNMLSLIDRCDPNKTNIEGIMQTDFNEISIVEFVFDLYSLKSKMKSRDPVNPINNDTITAVNNTDFLAEFEKAYIIQAILPFDESKKINIMNMTGLLTYSYLNSYNKKKEIGLNIDKYRQSIFIKHTKNFMQLFQELLKTYIRLFWHKKIYDIYFIEKIFNILKKHSSFYYEEFISFAEKWFISKFRPSINSFILEINKDLEPFETVLFVAGGDAMRRYDYDISFTKDIDTKLYINNAKYPEYLQVKVNNIERVHNAMKQAKEEVEEDLPLLGRTAIHFEKIEEAQNRAKILEEKKIIKEEIINIIVKHIVKLRNFLEENLESLLSISNPIVYKSDSTYNYSIFTSNVLDKRKAINQRFRTREIRRNETFPVDLYSIDFRTYLIQSDKDGNISRIVSHDISILDVVLQDGENDDYFPEYHQNFDNIPVASVSFLLTDFQKTYTDQERTLARILSDKYVKDIERQKKLYYIYHNLQRDAQSYDSFQNLKETILTTVYPSELKQNILNILDLFINKQQMQIQHFMQMVYIIKHINSIKTFHNKDLSKFIDIIRNITLFKKNLINENLNETESRYADYNYTLSSNKYVKQYYILFKRLTEIQDGVQKHKISFSNNEITKMYNEFFAKKTDSKRAKSVPSIVSKTQKSKSTRKSPTHNITRKRKVSQRSPNKQTSVSRKTKKFV